MVKYESIPLLGNWLKFTYTENPGMAFGIQFGPPGTITVLALIATALLVAYCWHVRNGYTPYVASLAFVMGGALGNMIDRVFYGVIMGYNDLFLGRVVDFVHVSLWRGFIPEVVPFIGGAYMELFPIWNVADMAIVLGVVGVLTFHHTYHRRLYAQQQRAVALDAEGTPRPEAMPARPGASSSAPLLDDASAAESSA